MDDRPRYYFDIGDQAFRYNTGRLPCFRRLVLIPTKNVSIGRIEYCVEECQDLLYYPVKRLGQRPTKNASVHVDQRWVEVPKSFGSLQPKGMDWVIHEGLVMGVFSGDFRDRVVRSLVWRYFLTPIKGIRYLLQFAGPEFQDWAVRQHLDRKRPVALSYLLALNLRAPKLFELGQRVRSDRRYAAALEAAVQLYKDVEQGLATVVDRSTYDPHLDAWTKHSVEDLVQLGEQLLQLGQPHALAVAAKLKRLKLKGLTDQPPDFLYQVGYRLRTDPTFAQAVAAAKALHKDGTMTMPLTEFLRIQVGPSSSDIVQQGSDQPS